MSVSSVKHSHSQPVGQSAGKGNVHAGENDLMAFNLRDTLNGITVREANFGEFLAALKKIGAPPARGV
jgi:hypothetical protein